MNTIRVRGGPGTELIAPLDDNQIIWMGSSKSIIDLLLEVRSLAVDVVVLTALEMGDAPLSQLLDEYPYIKVLVISADGDVSMHYRLLTSCPLGKWECAHAADFIRQAYEANHDVLIRAVH